MPKNILAYDEGYDAFDMGEAFDADRCDDWKEGWLDAAADENEE